MHRSLQVVAAAMDYAEQVLLCSPDAIQASMQTIKRSMAEHYNGDVVGSLRAQKGYPAAIRMNKGPNRREGPTAFAEKRKPVWVAPAKL